MYDIQWFLHYDNGIYTYPLECLSKFVQKNIGTVKLNSIKPLRLKYSTYFIYLFHIYTVKRKNIIVICLKAEIRDFVNVQ